jgi:hypothetical protein
MVPARGICETRKGGSWMDTIHCLLVALVVQEDAVICRNALQAVMTARTSKDCIQAQRKMYVARK